MRHLYRVLALGVLLGTRSLVGAVQALQIDRQYNLLRHEEPQQQHIQDEEQGAPQPDNRVTRCDRCARCADRTVDRICNVVPFILYGSVAYAGALLLRLFCNSLKHRHRE